MLDHMRAAANTWVAKAFLGLLLLSFALWGIPQAFYGQGSDTIYKSDKTTVTLSDYQFLAQNEATQYLFATGQYISPDQFAQRGLAQQILQRLNSFVLLDEEARRMKTNIGQEGTLRVLGQDKSFQVIDGKFSKEKFSQFIAQAGIRQNTYLDQLAKTGIRNQIIASVTENVQMPDVFYSALVLNNRELRNIDYITVTPSLIGTIADPAQDVLAAWYETNKVNFRAPEYRKATYITLTAQSLANPAAITEDELKDTYQKEIGKFSAPETREIEELRFANRQQADEAAAKLKSGMTFNDLAASLNQNLDAIRKGPVARADLPSLVAPEIFALQEGGTSNVINDLQGPVIIRVTKIIPSQAQAFDTVSSQIRQQLALAKAQQDLSSLVKTIDEEHFSGLSLNEIAQKHNLPITSVTIDAKGNNLQGKPVENIPNKENLVGGIFNATVGVDSDPLTGEEGVQWYQADEVIASRDRSVDEVRQAAIAAWKQQEMDRRVLQKAESINAELAKGKSLTQIASENNITVQQANALTRLGTGVDLSKEALAAIFSGPTNSTGIAPGNDEQTKLVFKVTATTEPASISPETLDAQTKEQLSLSLRQDVFAQYLFALEAAHGVEPNNAIIQQILNP